MSDDSQGEVPEVLPASHANDVCAYCGGNYIIKDLKLGLTSELGQIAVKFQASGKFLGIYRIGDEPVWAELCADCGTVTRTYVKQTDHLRRQGD